MHKNKIIFLYLIVLYNSTAGKSIDFHDFFFHFYWKFLKIIFKMKRDPTKIESL